MSIARSGATTTRGWVRPVIVGSALLLGLGLGGGTFALWNDGTPVAAQSILTGDLAATWGVDVTAVQTAAWLDGETVSTAPQVIADLDTFVARPGDAIQLERDLTVVLDGDNLAATVTIAAASDAVAPGLTLTYVLLEGGVPISSPTALGQPALALPLDGTTPLSLLAADGTPRELTMSLSVAVPGPDAVGTPPGSAAAGYPVVADLKNLTVTLTQVREGEGFTS